MWNRRLLFAAIVALGAGGSALASSFHFMQIEQVIGGADGDVTVQAVQLRMRAALQNQVQFAKLWVRDAAGENPVLLMDFPTSVANHGAGVRILVATAGFSERAGGVVPDFIFDNPIPASYLPAGTITFENDAGTIVYWRLSWGGDDYTGPNDGALTNDLDGDFGPPWPGPLPSEDLRALLFQGAASDRSTRNIDDYALTKGPSTWTNNAGESGTLSRPPCPEDIDGSGAVDFGDILAILAAWGPCDKDCPEDIDDSGAVDFGDILAVLAAWGPCD